MFSLLTADDKYTRHETVLVLLGCLTKAKFPHDLQ